MAKFDRDKNESKQTSRSKFRLRCLLGLLCMCAVSGATAGAGNSRGVSGESPRAQQAQTASAPQPDAKTILEASALACLRIKTIVYEVSEEQRDEHGHVLYSTVATIRQARANVPSSGFADGIYQVVGKTTMRGKETEEFSYAYNGTAFRMKDPEAKVILVVNSPSGYVVGQMLGPTRGLLVTPQFTQAEPFKRMIAESDRLAHEGIVEVGGVACHVIAVTMTSEHPAFGKQTRTSRWFIGVKDMLPRKFESGASRRTSRILEINKPSAETDYFLSVPAGYGEKLVTGKQAETKGLLAVGTVAPEWTLTDPRGRVHSLSDYRGKIVVLDFWATWCVPCRRSMPELQAIHEKFKDRGVVVLGLDVGAGEGDSGDPVAFMKNLKLTYGLLLKANATGKSYLAAVLPTLYVVSPEGKILHAEFGYRNDLRAELTELIEKQLNSQPR
jgi:thiol-disulfide isomerase/thioredoxin